MPSLAAFKWIAIAGLVLALAFTVNLAQSRGVKLAGVTAERDAAIKRADEWKTTYDDARSKEQATAAARALETQQLITLARDAGNAKEGIANAPGATDRFRYSDAAYGFLRARPTEAARPAAEADPGMDGR